MFCIITQIKRKDKTKKGGGKTKEIHIRKNRSGDIVISQSGRGGPANDIISICKRAIIEKTPCGLYIHVEEKEKEADFEFKNVRLIIKLSPHNMYVENFYKTTVYFVWADCIEVTDISMNRGGEDGDTITAETIF